MDTLSARTQPLSDGTSEMMKLFLLTQKNRFDEKTNVNGIINCGVAENYLCEEELLKKLKTIDVWESKNIYYPLAEGEVNLRVGLCRLFEKYFNLNSPLNPNRMLITSGLSGAISTLGFVIGDENDVFLIPSPYYTVFDQDIWVVSRCRMFRCPLLEQNDGHFRLSVEIFEKGYEEATSKGLKTRGIVIVNPHNPVGDVYDESTLAPIFKFAAEKQLHVIVDEIYAFSVFQNEPPFESMFNYKSIVDPRRTHFVWSFSKDFALSGLRMGVLYTGTDEMRSVSVPINFLQVPSSLAQETLAKLISDDEWLSYYINLNRERLTKRYSEVKQAIENIDKRIIVRPAHAAFFIWANFRDLLREATFAEENKFFKVLFESGLYIIPGAVLATSDPGWFRMVFCVPEQWISIAIDRLKSAIEVYANSQ